MWQSGTMQDLGTLGGTPDVPNTVALGINRSHQIFGMSTSTSGKRHGFFYDPAVCATGAE